MPGTGRIVGDDFYLRNDLDFGDPIIRRGAAWVGWWKRGS